MSEVNIIIKTKEDRTPAIPSKNYLHSTLKSFVILEKATAAGKTGVVIHTQLKDGKDVFISTTAAIFQNMAECLKGAEYRFSEGLPTIPDMPVIDVINQLIQMNKDQIDTEQISDGFNTFGELYSMLRKAKFSEEIEEALNKLKQK